MQRVTCRAPELAGIDAPVFSDLLLHDMGAAHRSERDANAGAATVTDAIVAHTGEAAAAFAAMSAADQQALINYLQGL